MTKLNRKHFLGGLGCAAAGTLFGAYIPRAFVPDDWYAPDPPQRRKKPAPAIPPPDDGVESFSQAGEDLNLDFTFRALFGGAQVTYLDVGAHHPTEINNTYFFYLRGGRGVLVEPNAAYCKVLRKYRPDDVTLEAGIGFGETTEADYYLLNESALNTFSKEQAERLVAESKGGYHIEEVRKVPLLNINDVMAEHFQGAPTFVSIDVEGLDLEILRSIDFARFRPKAFCVETLIANSRKQRTEIAEFLATQRYTARGGSFENTIFYDDALL